VNFANNEINRGSGIETPSPTFATLVNTGIGCSGKVITLCHSRVYCLMHKPVTDGLAWDWINEVVYWTDYCHDEIEVYDVSSRNRVVLINTGLVEPHDIVVDPRTK